MDLRSSPAASSIPASAGIGLRFPHHRHVIEKRPTAGWFEIHPENYMVGGSPLRDLLAIRRDAPISFHAVGLSLGGVDRPDANHLARLAMLIERVEPGLVSDHLSWSIAEGTYLADLLPLPYTEEALVIVARNIHAAQSALGRPLLIENPSAYLAFAHSTIGEPEFLAELVRRTGCGILCDVNNIYVASCNLGFDPLAYLRALPANAIGELHLAGHAAKRLDSGREIRIDTHGAAVSPAVWTLYEQALHRFGATPSLIEWDTEIPHFSVLEAEAARAQSLLDDLVTTEARHARVA